MQQEEPEIRVTHPWFIPLWLQTYNLATEYMDVSERTKKSYRAAPVAFGVWWETRGPGAATGSACTPAALTPEAVRSFAYAMFVAYGYDPVRANRYVAHLKVFAQWARQEGYLPANGPLPTEGAGFTRVRLPD